MPEHPPLRVLIVDDEPLGRQRVAGLVRKERGVEIVGMIGDGVSAVEAIRSLSPDLVFLDVQMPGMTGLEVVRTIGPADMPATVFVTAYDKHALAAFDLAAIDYLVKPFDDERFEEAFHRARRMARLEETSRLRDMLLAVLQGTGEQAPTVKTATRPGVGARARYLERIPVESLGKVRFIPVSDIDYILASGPYAELVVGDRKHLLRGDATREPARPRALFPRPPPAIAADRGRAAQAPGGDCDVQLRNGGRSRSRARGARSSRRPAMSPSPRRGPHPVWVEARIPPRLRLPGRSCNAPRSVNRSPRAREIRRRYQHSSRFAPNARARALGVASERLQRQASAPSSIAPRVDYTAVCARGVQIFEGGEGTS
jgi:two-component system LytT family response regulator